MIMDTGNIGAVVIDAQPSYRIGDNVTVRFVTGNPRNNYHDEGTFLTVERLDGPSYFVFMLLYLPMTLRLGLQLKPMKRVRVLIRSWLDSSCKGLLENPIVRAISKGLG